MITLSTHATSHLTVPLGLAQTNYINTSFSDGELSLKLETKLIGHDILIIGATAAPAQNLLELFALLQAVSDAKPKSITLLFSYFGYARQAPDQTAAVTFICQALARFAINKTIIFHAHAPEQLNNLLQFSNAIDLDFFCTAAQNYDLIAAPDHGALSLAQQIAERCNKEYVFLRKTRPNPETVLIESVEGNVENKKILLIDDVVATGSTLIAAAAKLKQLGALKIGAAATHGLFAHNAHARFMRSDIQQLYVTNSLPQTPSSIVQVYDSGPFLKKAIESTTKKY